MKKSTKATARRSYRLLLSLLSLVLIPSGILLFRLGTVAAASALLYGVTAVLPISMLATSVSGLRELSRARENDILAPRA